MADVTEILQAIDRGDACAGRQLLPLVYDELRKLAAVKLAREAPGQTLDATALVHEAYLRLIGDQQFVNRGHFFGAAAEAMRRILVDNVRRKRSLKRGGHLHRQPIDPNDLAVPESAPDLLALDEALDKLTVADPKIAEVVKLRFFAGQTIPEVAATLGISPRTADAWWAYARAWLLAELRA